MPRFKGNSLLGNSAWRVGVQPLATYMSDAEEAAVAPTIIVPLMNWLQRQNLRETRESSQSQLIFDLLGIQYRRQSPLHGDFNSSCRSDAEMLSSS